jgi:hypothetical protein
MFGLMVIQPAADPTPERPDRALENRLVDIEHDRESAPTRIALRRRRTGKEWQPET